MANALQANLAASLPGKSRPLPAILVGGCIVGVLDLLYAVLVYSPKKPILIPQTIAGGLLGIVRWRQPNRRARSPAAFFHRVLRCCRLLPCEPQASISNPTRRPRRAYGALVYLFMHLVVLPLSALPHGHTPLIYQAAEFVEHWFCVGLPIALSVRYYSQ